MEIVNYMSSCECGVRIAGMPLEVVNQFRLSKGHCDTKDIIGMAVRLIRSYQKDNYLIFC